MAHAASYRYDLGNSQFIYLSNQGILTTVTIYSGSVGQQQQSSQGVSTGPWTAPPKLYQLGGGHVAIVFSEQTFYLSIQGNQMQMSSGASGQGIEQQISRLEPLPMQPAEVPHMSQMKPMAPMASMQPMTMTMGNMSMSMGEMRMGDMNLSAESSQSQAKSSAQASHSECESSQKKFCPQCGTAVEAGDRFCSQCGHQLS